MSIIYVKFTSSTKKCGICFEKNSMPLLLETYALEIILITCHLSCRTMLITGYADL